MPVEGRDQPQHSARTGAVPDPRRGPAPSRAEPRLRVGIEERFTTAWRSFLPRAEQSVDVVPGHGPQALAAVWNQAVAARTPPRTGPVLTF